MKVEKWSYVYKDDPTYGEGNVSCGDELVAIVCGTNWGNWREDGDATFEDRTRLIAAAPDLLEALIQARRALAWASEQRPEFEAEYDLADHAIAKATGESA